MKKFILVILFWQTLLGNALWGAPARPGVYRLYQPDGTQIEICLKGDEFAHYRETTDGFMIQQGTDHFWYYTTLENGCLRPGAFKVSNISQRTPEEREYLASINQTALRTIVLNQTNAQKEKIRKTQKPGSIQSVFPTQGKVRGLVVLAEYQDVKFSKKATAQDFEQLINAVNYSGEFAFGSVRDYFLDQSNGKFDVDFDVAGPVCLSQNREYYGKGSANGGGLGGERVPEMVEEAVTLAYNQYKPDFTDYDSNQDGFVDFIYVIYAGHGESQGGPAESVWPQSSTLEYDCWKTFDGLYLGKYSCSCELRGAEGEEIDGIGTFCHEFSHILGLPDIYDPMYSGFDGLGYWDVMDIGSYNDNSRTPAGYSAMEKYTLGWIDPTVLENSQKNVQLNPSVTTHEALFIVSDKDHNEYFTLENRQPISWDSALPGHGLLVCRIHYDASLWASNRVNTLSSKYEHVKLIPADGTTDSKSGNGDTYPGENGIEQINTSGNTGALWHDNTPLQASITNIREQGQNILFDFDTTSSNLKNTYTTTRDILISIQGRQAILQNTEENGHLQVFTAGGQIVASQNYGRKLILNLEPGCYIVTDGQIIKKFLVY